MYVVTVCVCSVASDSLSRLDCSPSGSSVHGNFFRQEYWSGLPFPTPGDLPHPGFEPMSPVDPALQTDSLPRSHLGNFQIICALAQR